MSPFSLKFKKIFSGFTFEQYNPFYLRKQREQISSEKIKGKKLSVKGFSINLDEFLSINTLRFCL